MTSRDPLILCRGLLQRVDKFKSIVQKDESILKRRTDVMNEQIRRLDSRITIEEKEEECLHRTIREVKQRLCGLDTITKETARDMMIAHKYIESMGGLGKVQAKIDGKDIDTHVFSNRLKALRIEEGVIYCTAKDFVSLLVVGRKEHFTYSMPGEIPVVYVLGRVRAVITEDEASKLCKVDKSNCCDILRNCMKPENVCEMHKQDANGMTCTICEYQQKLFMSYTTEIKAKLGESALNVYFGIHNASSVCETNSESSDVVFLGKRTLAERNEQGFATALVIE